MSDSVVGDTFYCRFNWAVNVAASTNPTQNNQEAMCLNAGPSGGTECRADPSACLDYCSDVSRQCTGDSQIYESAAACLRACNAFPPGNDAAADRNTVGCRHAQLAGPSTSVQQCAKASATSVGASGSSNPSATSGCGTKCENLCMVAMSACTGRLAIFPDVEACLATCASFPEGSGLQQINGNTLTCRYNQARLAVNNPQLACERMSLSGGGVCGKACENYCTAGSRLCADDQPWVRQCVCARARLLT
jgi:hypothetical protein